MKRRILFTVEKDRVLVPVGEPCPFGCRYCYTRGGEVGLSRVDAADVLSHFQQFAEKTSFETIQFGYDGDPFAHPERGIAMLKQLAMLGKHVNFSTKALLSDTTIKALSEIRCHMEAVGTKLSALVSLSCWDSAALVEPHTPSPRERVLTITHLKNIDVSVFIAVRPILPHIADYEYEQIANEGIRAGCDGFILGPLYSDDRGQFASFIPPKILDGVERQRGLIPWAAHKLSWTRYEDVSRLQRLLLMIESKGGATFLSSADAMKLVHQQGVVA